MNNRENREGSFYASKVRLFLNEYGGINLEEFCKAERVSYQKMCNSLGRPSYRKASENISADRSESCTSDLKAEIGLKPLVVDYPPKVISESSSRHAEPAILPSTTIRLKGMEIRIVNCEVNSMVSLLKGLEAELC